MIIYSSFLIKKDNLLYFAGIASLDVTIGFNRELIRPIQPRQTGYTLCGACIIQLLLLCNHQSASATRSASNMTTVWYWVTDDTHRDFSFRSFLDVCMYSREIYSSVFNGNASEMQTFHPSSSVTTAHSTAEHLMVSTADKSAEADLSWEKNTVPWLISQADKHLPSSLQSILHHGPSSST